MKDLGNMSIPEIIAYVKHLEARSGANAKDIMDMDFFAVRDYVKSLESEIAHNETV